VDEVDRLGVSNRDDALRANRCNDWIECMRGDDDTFLVTKPAIALIGVDRVVDCVVRGLVAMQVGTEKTISLSLPVIAGASNLVSGNAYAIAFLLFLFVMIAVLD